MSNSLTAASPTYWSRNAGKKLYKTMVSRSFVSFEEQSLVDNDGRIVDRPYRSNVVSEDYVKGTAATAQDLTYVSDQMTIDQFHTVLMYVDDIDKLQNKYKTVRLWSEEAGLRLGLRADANLLYEVFSATPDIDDSDLGGTADEGISLTVSKVPQIFAQINEELDNNDVPEAERFFCFSPLFFNKLWQYIGGKESMLGDKVAVAGHVGQYAGLDLFKSNNVTGTARWTPADNPSNGATIVIEGITFTFVSTIAAVAGNILQTTDLETTLTALADLINAGGVTSDVGVSNVSLSTANQRAVQSWVATAEPTTYIEVRVKGTPSLTVTTSEALDTWDAKYTNQALLAGRKKTAIDAVFQIGRMGIVDTAIASTVSAGKRGSNVMPLITYGKKVYNQGKNEIVKILVRSDS